MTHNKHRLNAEKFLKKRAAGLLDRPKRAYRRTRLGRVEGQLLAEIAAMSLITTDASSPAMAYNPPFILCGRDNASLIRASIYGWLDRVHLNFAMIPECDSCRNRKKQKLKIKNKAAWLKQNGTPAKAAVASERWYRDGDKWKYSRAGDEALAAAAEKIAQIKAEVEASAGELETCEACGPVVGAPKLKKLRERRTAALRRLLDRGLIECKEWSGEFKLSDRVRPTLIKPAHALKHGTRERGALIYRVTQNGLEHLTKEDKLWRHMEAVESYDRMRAGVALDAPDSSQAELLGNSFVPTMRKADPRNKKGFFDHFKSSGRGRAKIIPNLELPGLERDLSRWELQLFEEDIKATLEAKSEV